MTVETLLASVSSSELTEWAAYFEVKQFERQLEEPDWQP